MKGGPAKGERERSIAPVSKRRHHQLPFAPCSSMKDRPLNGNHLLNFKAPSRDTSSRRGHQKHPRRHYDTSAGQQPFERGRYLRANHRFIVRGSADNPLRVEDPDGKLDWSYIEQVLIATGTLPQCPICLDHPRVPKITECGHIFCFPCILHYLSLSEKKWRKCPICYDSIYATSLTSVRLQERMPITQDLQLRQRENITDLPSVHFTLLQRATNSTVVLPRRHWRPWAVSAFPALATAFADPALDIAYAYTRYVLACLNYIEDQILRPELDALDAWKSQILLERFSLAPADHQEAEETLPFLDMAIHQLEAYKTQLRQHFYTFGEIAPIKQARPKANKTNDFISPVSLANEENAVLFYQADDGQTLFLSPLDIKVLKAALGSYDQFPYEINVPVEATHEVTLSEAERKRTVYLRHLPLGCDITLCDVDVRDLVPPVVFDTFAAAYAQRAQKREQKKASEAKAQKRAAALQAKQNEADRREAAPPLQSPRVDPHFFATAFPAFAQTVPPLEEPSAESKPPVTKQWGPKKPTALPKGDAWGPSIVGEAPPVESEEKEGTRQMLSLVKKKKDPPKREVVEEPSGSLWQSSRLLHTTPPSVETSKEEAANAKGGGKKKVLLFSSGGGQRGRS